MGDPDALGPVVRATPLRPACERCGHSTQEAYANEPLGGWMRGLAAEEVEHCRGGEKADGQVGEGRVKCVAHPLATQRRAGGRVTQ